jgi:hypothetical protein
MYRKSYICDMKKPKREITPHKGGRSIQMKFLVTPEEKKAIDKAKGEMSLADFILLKIKRSRK